MNNQESRRFKRHKLQNTFVVGQEGICQVLDLSADGVSFGCTKLRKFSEISTVDIIDSSGFQIWDLPIETIWAEKNDAYPTSSIHALKMGARFHKDLTNEQISALSQLMQFLEEETPELNCRRTISEED